MIQRFVDDVLAVTKESVKTFTYESLNNVVRLINGLSALLLTLLPGRGSVLEGVHGWELRPTFRGPRFPRWMENGVSSFNQFIHELSVDSDDSSLDYSSGEEDGIGNEYPATPSSQSSRGSRSSPGSPWPSIKRVHSHKEHVVHSTTDRRRGVIEDLHLASEIFIESAFEMVHKAAHFILSPLDTIRTLFRWLWSWSSCERDHDAGVIVPTATLGDDDPVPSERTYTFHQSLNTDARTCQDVITELGYPYEAIRVVTNDGYVLLLERIPRRDARKVLYLQHGIFDSSMGWVSNGVVGSPAFAAFDQGYDVYLGNFRGLVSREHVDKNISSRQYWKYSINEHAMEDIPAMIEKIHEVKTSELKLSQPELAEETDSDQPFKLCALCHSMGGAAMLMYVITRRIEEKPHRLSRLVLLSPAGFHDDAPFIFTVIENLLLLLSPLLAPFVPGLYIPTRFFRMLLNKLARDFHHYPAVGGLVQTVVSYFLGGDSSNWVGVLGIPHYNMNDMPGVSFRVGLHLAQMKHAKKFRMFDYGNASQNMEAYGSPEPLDLGEYFGLFDIPVDLVAGRKDQVIRPTMVKRYYKMMKDAGVDVSFNEFEYAHLDFTFSHREELLAYVMSRLLLVGEPGSKPKLKLKPSQKVPKLRRNDKLDG
ncbi:lipase member N isoform X2 [Cucurbita moschata]|uniref:Lipase member N isoform X2 n=1 Tax=Cucurbita moschata TaxID=3662 RepID=A0A6J1E7W0_CUCMO|nr:lipase member N isoform X2 [Cucurbita moschata]